MAGDPNRTDINYTKLEIGLRHSWWNKYIVKLDLKPVIDWQQDGPTGAIAELEGRLRFARRWQTWLLLGERIWGADLISTYGKRIEIGIAVDF